jgi:hypothetical protein
MLAMLGACASGGPVGWQGGGERVAAPARDPQPAEAPTASVPVGVPAAHAQRPFPTRVASVAFDVRVLPPGPVEVAGFVRDRDGNPVARACVELTAAGASRSPVFTSPQGDFRFTRVPAGRARVTMTVADLAVVDRTRIADYHTHDPSLTVMLRPLVLAPAHGLEVTSPIRREGDDGDGGRWIEVAPLALDLPGYSPACRRALEPPARRSR